MNKISNKSYSALIHKAGHCYHVENCDHFSILKEIIKNDNEFICWTIYIPAIDDSCSEVQQPAQASYCLLCKDLVYVPAVLCKLP